MVGSPRLSNCVELEYSHLIISISKRISAARRTFRSKAGHLHLDPECPRRLPKSPRKEQTMALSSSGQAPFRGEAGVSGPRRGARASGRGADTGVESTSADENRHRLANRGVRMPPAGSPERTPAVCVEYLPALALTIRRHTWWAPLNQPDTLLAVAAQPVVPVRSGFSTSPAFASLMSRAAEVVANLRPSQLQSNFYHWEVV